MTHVAAVTPKQRILQARTWLQEAVQVNHHDYHASFGYQNDHRSHVLLRLRPCGAQQRLAVLGKQGAFNAAAALATAASVDNRCQIMQFVHTVHMQRLNGLVSLLAELFAGSLYERRLIVQDPRSFRQHAPAATVASLAEYTWLLSKADYELTMKARSIRSYLTRCFSSFN
jgi:hypothetical protein